MNTHQERTTEADDITDDVDEQDGELTAEGPTGNEFKYFEVSGRPAIRETFKDGSSSTFYFTGTLSIKVIRVGNDATIGLQERFSDGSTDYFSLPTELYDAVYGNIAEYVEDDDPPITTEVDTRGFSVGDTVTFEWTDGSEKTGEITEFWRDPTADDPDSAHVDVIEDGWENGRTYDIAVSWIKYSRIYPSEDGANNPDCPGGDYVFIA